AAPCDTPYFETAFAVEVSTHAEGMFDFAGLAPGQYCLTVGDRFLTNVRAEATVVIKDRDIDDISLKGPIPAQLRGRVQIDSDHAALLRNARIFFVDPENDPVMNGSVPLLPDGTFAFSYRAGPTLLRFAGVANGAYVQSIRLGTRELDNPFVLTAAGNLDVI